MHRARAYPLLLLVLAMVAGFFPLRVCHAEVGDTAAVVTLGDHSPHGHHDFGHEGSACCEDTPIDVARPGASPDLAAPSTVTPFEPALPVECDSTAYAVAPVSPRRNVASGVLSVVLLR